MPDETDPPLDSETTGRGSPTPGCCILAAIVGIFGGLILLYIVVGIYQIRGIGEFTQETAARLEIAAPSPTQVEEARGKLKRIGEAVEAGRAERILFSADDLNVLIASLDEASGFRGNTRIESIGPEGIVASMSQAMRKGPFQRGFRFLNAQFILQPELRARSIAFKVIDIRPVAGDAPRGFVDSYGALDLFRLDPELPALKATVSSLSAVYTEADQLVVETKVGEAKGD